MSSALRARARSLGFLMGYYNKGMKSFFRYRKYSSVISMLLDVQLPSFNTEMSNSRISLTSQLRSSSNNIIRHVCLIQNV